MKKLVLYIFTIFYSLNVFAQNYLNYAQGKEVKTSLGDKNASKITDGNGYKNRQWRCSTINQEQWVEIDLAAEFTVYAAHIYYDIENLMPLQNWVLQYKDGKNWKDIPGTAVQKNYNERVEQKFTSPVSTSAIRLKTKNKEAFGINEIQIWGDKVPKMPYGLDLKPVETYKPESHWVCVNQIAYNIGAPKFFTVPTAKSNLPFTISEKKSGKVCYKGKLNKCKGDFTSFNPNKPGVEYVITVKGDGLKPGESYPFEIGKRAIQRMSYVPAAAFMNDARSLVGSHPSAYGGTPWRDGTYYTGELPSMVMLYLSDPEYFKQLPVTLSWEKDSANVLSPNFKKTKDAVDRDALTTAQSYYTLLPKPKSLNVPDLIQNIRFTAGWYLIDPITQDPSGDPVGEKMHAQTVEQLAYFLYGYPAYKQYISKEFYNLVLNATLRWWKPVGLYEVITAIGTGKGRECPGHSIMPNLLMYEVAKRECPDKAEAFMKAAVAQTQWVIDNIDLNNPLFTKGQRMSEYKLVVGLTDMYLNYRDFAPKGTKEKIEQLAKAYIKNSDNMWDFRRFDLQDNWTIPSFSDCGNVAGFPACAFAVAMCVDDAKMKNRLIQLGYSHFDNLYGRNPLNAHAANHPENGFVGVDYGFPFRYHDNVCARLETTRGSISSLPGTEMYPFNPKGKNRWPEGWTAYNANWNISLAYLNFIEKNSSVKVFSNPELADKTNNIKVGDKLNLKDYNLTFSDEFNGNSLDLSKWVYRTDVKHRSVQLRENVEIKNGLLKLNLHRLQKPLHGKMATGAGIITRDRFRYGYYEVRAKLGTGKVDFKIDQGWHHSFWAMAAVVQGDSVGTTYPALRRTEIDCYENSNNLNEYTQHIIIWKADGKEFGRRPNSPADVTKIDDFEASQWHTYGFEWTPDRVIFYVDGVVRQIGEYPSSQFEHDEINVWLSAISANWCSKNQKDSEAYYDYFRFYKRS